MWQDSIRIDGHPDFVRMSDIPRLERERERRAAGDAIATDAVADYLRSMQDHPELGVDFSKEHKLDQVSAEVIEVSRIAYTFVGDELIAEDSAERRAQVAQHIASICLHVRTFFPLSVSRHDRRQRRTIKRLASDPDGALTQVGIEWQEDYVDRMLVAYDLGLVAGLEASDE